MGLKSWPPGLNTVPFAWYFTSTTAPDKKIFAIIFEDDAYSIEVLGQYLEFSGVNYRAIMDAKDIAEQIKAFPKVDIVFVDLELAGSNGYNVLKAIRSEPGWESVPIVAYTSHTEEKLRARDAGFHSFLGKPLSSAAFPNQLQNILNNQPVWE